LRAGVQGRQVTLQIRGTSHFGPLFFIVSYQKAKDMWLINRRDVQEYNAPQICPIQREGPAGMADCWSENENSFEQLARVPRGSSRVRLDVSHGFPGLLRT
jgi:hypothetical protein